MGPLGLGAQLFEHKGSRMHSQRTHMSLGSWTSLLLAAALAACASKPEAPRAPEMASPSVERFRLALEDGISLDYQVEKKLSKVNSKSCFAFISGKLHNLSGKTLSKKSVLDVAVLGQGKQLYRDNTNPLEDIASGANAPFEMIVSPVFADGCPKFDKINIAFRKVVL